MLRRLLPAAAAVLLLAAPAAAAWASAPRSEIPLEGDGRTWIVRVTVDGRASGRFLLDTGASLCVISPKLVERLGLRPSGDRVTLQTANGVVSAPLVHLADVAIDGNRGGRARGRLRGRACGARRDRRAKLPQPLPLRDRPAAPGAPPALGLRPAGASRYTAVMDPFAGRVAVVTGGGSGIGAALARAFAARGAHLVLAD